MTATVNADDLILNINKPEGWTSFDVVRKIRNVTRIKKVGHAGSLDPFASGVLLVALGKATRQIVGLMDLKKEYVGEIELGTLTDTLDPTGELIEKRSFEGVTETAIQSVCRQFVGEIEQVPPAFSAIKIDGVRSYALARKGRPVPLKARKVTVYSLDILKIELPMVRIKIVCSKGTYVRALARDIGEKLGPGGILKSLVRTRIGNYLLENSIPVEEFSRLAPTEPGT